MNRREFLLTTLAGSAGLCVSGVAPGALAASTPVPMPDEDGHQLWLRYAPPGDAAGSYRTQLQSLRVEGTSATCTIIRDELRAATAALLGRTVPVDDVNLADGALLVGTPANSELLRELNWSAALQPVGD